MFLDQGKEERPVDITSFKTAEGGKNRPLLNVIYYIIVVVIILAVAFAIFYVYFLKPQNFKNNNTIHSTSSAQTTIATSSGSKLPGEYNVNKKNNFDPGVITNIKAEDLSFGYFYEKWRDDFVPHPESYQLPVNIKDDVANYYDVSRKFDLDAYLSDLNNNGFAIAGNNFRKEANNFFDFYRLLIKKDVPLAVTVIF